jgi:hypothetical protein
MIYNATTRNEEYYHQDATIAEVNAVTDEELVVTARGSTHKFASTFDMVDYEDDPDKDKYSPYWPTNNPEGEKKYLYLNVKGKIIYTAPDGNWGLLADGDQCLEFYAGKGTPFVTSNFPNITKDRVLISGNMSQYNGNIQLGFITKIKESLENEGIEEPVLTYPELKEADIAAFKVEGYTCEKQAIDGFSNSLHSVTGTLVADSILDKEGNVVKNIDSLANNRFTYQLQVGEQVMTVAYDYHTDKEGQVGLFNALKTALKKGGQMTVKGTMRYNGNDDDCFITEGNKGVWNIVPFYTDHVVSK